jgi:cobalamin biosynthesis protein CobD/CbiB
MRDQDAQFLKWLEDHEVWYERQSTLWGRLLMACKLLALSATIISIVVAAASTPEYFSSTGRWLIIVAAALTAISTEALSQLKVREMEELREDGNIEASRLLIYARQKFDEFADDPQRISQYRRHVAIDSRQGPRESEKSN